MIVSASELWPEIKELYEKGMPSGQPTGWRSLDPYYTVGKGQWTLVTGQPGHGKSEWVDALMVNLIRQGWKFLVWSAENLPQSIHAAKLMEKLTGKPFGKGPTQRMDDDDLMLSYHTILDDIKFIKPKDNGYSVDAILNVCGQEITDNEHDGPWGVVIDPWNELEHRRPTNLSETEYISHALSHTRAWAREWNTHVWIVAHPAKLQRDKEGKLPKPTPNDVAGSHHWWAKADNAITVWRDTSADTQMVEVLVQKIRFKHIGKPGLVELRYDRVTGRYHDKISLVSDMKAKPFSGDPIGF